MTEKELKKLNRYQLLELIILQTEQISDLEKQLEETRQALDSQQIQLTQAGSIAEAAMQLSGIFEAAQTAADTYLENVKRQTENAARIEEDARQNARQQLDQAQQDADKILEDARSEAQTILTDARTDADATHADAETVLENAHAEARTIRAEAQALLDAAEKDAEAVRAEAAAMLEENTRKCAQQEEAVNSYIASIKEAFHLQFQNLDQMTRK